MKLSLAGSKGGIALNKGKGKQAGPASSSAPKNAFGMPKPTGGRATKTAFGDDEQDGEDDDGDLIPKASTSKAAASSSRTPAVPRIDPTRPTASSNPSRLLKKMHDEAATLDPTVFSYDEVYDNMKAGALAAEQARKEAKEADKPKYVSNLLKAAEQRKKDRIRAEDKLIEREREKEGDEFQDKDSFVTSAYKEQQEELRKAEEEEKKREGGFYIHVGTRIMLIVCACSEEASKRPGGMSAYYQRELARQEAIHAAAVAASATASSSGESKPLSEMAAMLAAHGPKNEAELAAEASKELGRHVQVNEEGQIVDKRELLTGGLNIKPRKVQGPAPGPPGSSEGGEPKRGAFSLTIAERKSQLEEIAEKEKERKAREDAHSLEMHGMTLAQRQKISRERQSRELERQMVESQEKKRKAEEEKERESIKKVARRNNDESKVEELKRKALERRLKRQEEEKAAAQAS